jgi:uroporphyrinogen-III synthase
MSDGNFKGLRVLALESRRAPEISKLIANSGGEPLVVPSVKEVPLESNAEALEFARELDSGRLEMVIFMTGVGVRLLTQVVARLYSPEHFAERLKKVVVVARGPKPIGALRDLGVLVNMTVPEPNTWHDLIAEFDRRKQEFPLHGKRVALQEYGSPNSELIAALENRGAIVTAVPVYEWTLPDGIEPLKAAVAKVIAGEVSVLLVTSSVQVRHLFKVARDMGRDESLRKAFKKVVIASIGPLTSEEIRHQGLNVDFEPSHPKMGFLVQETAQRSNELLDAKRGPL